MRADWCLHLDIMTETRVAGRYLFGGRAPGCENELLYRFEFPERPGALKARQL